MKHHNDATATLRSINAVLRRAEDLHWSDPEFLAWERGQVGDIDERATDPVHDVRYTRWEPGPEWEPPAGDDDDADVYVRPMCQLIEPPDGLRTPMRTRARDYPDQVTMSGPLLLGPEPAKVTPGQWLDRAQAAVSTWMMSPRMAALFAGATRPGPTRQSRDPRFIRGMVPSAAIVDETRHLPMSWFDPETAEADARQETGLVSEAIRTFSLSLTISVEEIRSLADALITPMPPVDEDSGISLTPDTTREDVTRWLTRRRAWHTFTAGPQHRPRRDHRTGPRPRVLPTAINPRRPRRRR